MEKKNLWNLNLLIETSPALSNRYSLTSWRLAEPQALPLPPPPPAAWNNHRPRQEEVSEHSSRCRDGGWVRTFPWSCYLTAWEAGCPTPYQAWERWQPAMGCLPGLASTEELLFPDRKIKIPGENILIWQKKKLLLAESHWTGLFLTRAPFCPAGRAPRLDVWMNAVRLSEGNCAGKLECCN